MGQDSKLHHIGSERTVDCDRWFNLKNPYTEDTGLYEALSTSGVIGTRIIEACEAIKDIILYHTKDNSMYDQIISGIKEIGEDEMFILKMD